MSASGRTDYFAIPIYQLGDTCEYIPSYNNGMTIIDAQMQANKAQGLQNQSQLETQGSAITTIQNQITEINDTIETINATKVIATTINTQNCNSEQIIGFMINVNGIFGIIQGAFIIGKKDADIPVVVSVDQMRLCPVASIPGNPFNLGEGATNYLRIGMGTTYQEIIETSQRQAGDVEIMIWESGGRTQIGFRLANNASNAFTWLRVNYTLAVPCNPW